MYKSFPIQEKVQLALSDEAVQFFGHTCHLLMELELYIQEDHQLYTILEWENAIPLKVRDGISPDLDGPASASIDQTSKSILPNS